MCVVYLIHCSKGLFEFPENFYVVGLFIPFFRFRKINHKHVWYKYEIVEIKIGKLKVRKGGEEVR